MKLKIPDKLKEPIHLPKLRTPKLSAPKLRRSSGGVRTPKAPKAPKARRAPRAPRATPNVKAPKFLTDLYADLRDRRLLIPVAALLVGLVAVPLLLGGGSSEPAVPPPPVAAAGEDEAAAVQSAVLVEQVGIRDYEKRLAALKEKNPFEQQFPLPSGGGGGGGGGSDGSSTTTTTVDDVTSTGSGSTTTSETSITETTGSGGGSTTEVTSVDETTVEESKPPIRFYAGRVDVTVGPLGETKKVEGVRYLTILPSEKTPVVAFLGLGEGGDKAVFSVSSEVVETKGDGHCAPKRPAPCQFLTLKTGDQRTFKFENGKTFRLRLLDTHVVRVPDPRKSGDGD